MILSVKLVKFVDHCLDKTRIKVAELRV